MAIGAFLMLTRLVLGTSGEMANNDHVVGALVLTVAIIATAEVARALRFINVGFGAWLVAAPFLLEGVGAAGTAASIALGAGLVGLSLPRGGLLYYALAAFFGRLAVPPPIAQPKFLALIVAVIAIIVILDRLSRRA